MRKNLLLGFSALLFCLFISGRPAFATHFVGSDFGYQAVPGQANTYVLTVNFYRDCGGIPAPTNVLVHVTSASASIYTQVMLPLLSFSEVSEVCFGLATECSNPPGTVQGIQKYIYSDTVTLLTQAPDWVFRYQECCRNAGIINLPQSSDQFGYYIEAYLNNSNGIVNTSPTYTASPAPYFCVNDTVTYTPQVTDQDGDSLVFSFGIPYDENMSNPYSPFPVPIMPGYSISQPFGLGVPVALDSTTGMLEFIPNTVGAFVMVLNVEEYRYINGVAVKVGETRRDIQVQVLACTTPCPMAGNNIGVNGNNQSGSQMVAVLANDPLQISIPATSTNPNVTLTMTSNCAIEIPGSTFTVQGSGSSVTGIFNWVPTPAHVSTTPHFFSFRVEDNACPVPNERYGIVKVLVSQNPSGTAKPVTGTPVLLPNTLVAGQNLVLPQELGTAGLQIFDSTGKLVFKQQSYSNTWNAAAVPSGIYLYQIQLYETGQVFGSKLVVSK